MFGRNGAKSRPARSTRVESSVLGATEASGVPREAASIVGQQSRVEGMFEIADPIQMRQGAQK